MIHDLAVRLFYNHSSETVPGDNPDYKYQGLAMRAQYGFNKRYYAEVTASYQGSSNYKSGNVPDFSLLSDWHGLLRMRNGSNQ